MIGLQFFGQRPSTSIAWGQPTERQRRGAAPGQLRFAMICLANGHEQRFQHDEACCAWPLAKSPHLSPIPWAMPKAMDV
ncbi:MAG: hypothetical protein KDB00_18505, partial [Planctomycetales bacterium]|nr:hypothetical protein [Planctomycetales bacterium]